MSKDIWRAVDEYIAARLLPSDPALDAALKASDEAGLPAIAVSPTHGKLLSTLARMMNARNVLEIWTLGGYSTIWLGRAVSPDGHVTSLELAPKHAEVARANLARAGLSQVVEIK